MVVVVGEEQEGLGGTPFLAHEQQRHDAEELLAHVVGVDRGRLVLLDEPTSMLDAPTADQVREAILTVAGGRTPNCSRIGPSGSGSAGAPGSGTAAIVGGSGSSETVGQPGRGPLPL